MGVEGHRWRVADARQHCKRHPPKTDGVLSKQAILIHDGRIFKVNGDRQTPTAMKPACYADIQRRYQKGRDYHVDWRTGASCALIMAPHGGGIEPGTHQIAHAVAGRDHGYYAFIGTLPAGNRALHLPSTRFDEPRAMTLAAGAAVLVVIHGCREKNRIIFIGGRDEGLGHCMANRLSEAGIDTAVSEKFPGRHPRNLCNRFPKTRGVQLELSTSLRDELTKEAAGGPPALAAFSSAVRTAIHEVIQHGGL